MSAAEQVEEGRAWLIKADEDVTVARRCLAGPEPLPGAAAYHVQQAAEKLLKGLLALQAAPFRKTHNLNELGLQLTALVADLAPLVTPLNGLTPWAFAFRYPGLDEPSLPTLAEIETALRDVDSLRAAFLARLTESP
jgi:hypothetical protein